MKKMKIYVAGPMSGYSLYNFPAFDAAALKLRREGHEVVSPAELDRIAHVHEFTENLPPNFMREAMRRDLDAICDCDAIYLLKGWEKSSGVTVELALANLLKLTVVKEENHDMGTDLKTKLEKT